MRTLQELAKAYGIHPRIAALLETLIIETDKKLDRISGLYEYTKAQIFEREQAPVTNRGLNAECEGLPKTQKQADAWNRAMTQRSIRVYNEDQEELDRILADEAHVLGELNRSVDIETAKLGADWIEDELQKPDNALCRKRLESALQFVSLSEDDDEEPELTEAEAIELGLIDPPAPSSSMSPDVLGTNGDRRKDEIAQAQMVLDSAKWREKRERERLKKARQRASPPKPAPVRRDENGQTMRRMKA